MAARKKKKKSSIAGTCKIVRVHGKRRKMCWDKKGRIKSNKAA